MRFITNEEKDLVVKTVELICKEQRVSSLLIQSSLRIGHNQALDVMEYLTKKGILQERLSERETGQEQKLKISIQDLRKLDLEALFREDSEEQKPIMEGFVSEKKYLALEERLKTVEEDHKNLEIQFTRLTSAPGYEQVVDVGMTRTYWWATGGRHTEPLLVECFLGCRFEIKEGVKTSVFDTWFTFPKPFPEMIPRKDLHNWAGLSSLSWYGPIRLPSQILTTMNF